MPKNVMPNIFWSKISIFKLIFKLSNSIWKPYLLWFLFLEENSKIVSAERGLLDIISAMKRYSDQPTLVEAACAALWSLSMEGVHTRDAFRIQSNI